MKTFEYKVKSWGWYFRFSNPKEVGAEVEFTIDCYRVPWLALFLGRGGEGTFRVRGSGTVWHNYPSGRRQPTGGPTGEYNLSDVYTAYRYFKENNEA